MFKNKPNLIRRTISLGNFINFMPKKQKRSYEIFKNSDKPVFYLGSYCEGIPTFKKVLIPDFYSNEKQNQEFSGLAFIGGKKSILSRQKFKGIDNSLINLLFRDPKNLENVLISKAEDFLDLNYDFKHFTGCLNKKIDYHDNAIEFLKDMLGKEFAKTILIDPKFIKTRLNSVYELDKSEKIESLAYFGENPEIFFSERNKQKGLSGSNSGLIFSKTSGGLQISCTIKIVKAVQNTYLFLREFNPLGESPERYALYYYANKFYKDKKKHNK